MKNQVSKSVQKLTPVRPYSWKTKNLLHVSETANNEGVLNGKILESSFFAYICTDEFAEKSQREKDNLVHEFRQLQHFIAGVRSAISFG
jgi:O-methyltransferase involved in polyketide biosynthesis